MPMRCALRARNHPLVTGFPRWANRRWSALPATLDSRLSSLAGSPGRLAGWTSSSRLALSWLSPSVLTVAGEHPSDRPVCSRVRACCCVSWLRFCDSLPGWYCEQTEKRWDGVSACEFVAESDRFSPPLMSSVQEAQPVSNTSNTDVEARRRGLLSGRLIHPSLY